VPFFAGRIVSYSLYAGGATLVETSLEGTFTDAFRSPLGVAVQVLMLFGLVALVRVDWIRLLQRPRRHVPPNHGQNYG
jgi:hypothetical protein